LFKEVGPIAPRNRLTVLLLCLLLLLDNPHDLLSLDLRLKLAHCGVLIKREYVNRLNRVSCIT